MREIQCYTPFHNEYPERLRACTDKPSSLFVKGEMPDDKIPAVAIVGARMCSAYGKEYAYHFAKELASRGVQIISGMARGVDSYAHRGALDGGGKTFAVLGCGVDICYPRQNYDLYRKIQEQGGVISEYDEGVPPYPANFPMRNRIISALADVVLVIEAKKRSGSLITADYALEQGKSVFALPGRLGDSLSEGCNWLISQGAGIAVSTEILLEELGIFNSDMGEIHKKNNFRLETEKKIVYSCLDFDPKSLSEITAETSLPIEKISGILLELELDGLIDEPMKNCYVKKL